MKKTCSRGHVFEKTSACPTCPACWPGRKTETPAAGDLPVKLGGPALRALDRAGVRSLFRLSQRTEREIADLHGMGPKGIGLLKAALRKLGLKFRRP
jgi:hypothetical protein